MSELLSGISVCVSVVMNGLSVSVVIVGCSGGNVMNAASAVGSTNRQRLVTVDSGGVGPLKTTCNVTTVKSPSLYQSPTFTHDDVDDDFEPLPSCKLLVMFEHCCQLCVDCSLLLVDCAVHLDTH